MNLRELATLPRLWSERNTSHLYVALDDKVEFTVRHEAKRCHAVYTLDDIELSHLDADGWVRMLEMQAVPYMSQEDGKS